ncbi:MAG: hypothetical protein SCH71_04270 [Desulfobulbaceae bacterium]|nr:hypothetical protein [Desulfobulbaceae bacterium]
MSGKQTETAETGCPLKGREVLDLYFLENRARLLEIASFLDRIGRCEEPEAIRDNYLYRSFIKAMGAVLEHPAGRTEAVQLIFSDLTELPSESAGAPAAGAWKGGGG